MREGQPNPIPSGTAGCSGAKMVTAVSCGPVAAAGCLLPFPSSSSSSEALPWDDLSLHRLFASTDWGTSFQTQRIGFSGAPLQVSFCPPSTPKKPTPPSCATYPQVLPQHLVSALRPSTDWHWSSTSVLSSSGVMDVPYGMFVTPGAGAQHRSSVPVLVRIGPLGSNP